MPPGTRARRATIAVLAAAAALAGATPASAVTTQRGTVARVVDGDSVRVKIAGRTATFNLLGVNAPDGRQCYATQAKRALSGLLPVRSRVRVVKDRRRGGRGRYVYRGAKFINAALLKAGAARSSGLTGLSAAGTLRRSTKSAQNADRGLFGRCGSSPPPTPAAPGPIENARAVRAALTGKQLLDLTSTANSSTKNTTRFCDGGRSDRSEEFNGTSGFFRNDLTGTWAVFEAARQADGTLLAQISFLADDPDFDQRLVAVSIAPDGTVRRVGANASELQAGGPCSPYQPFAGFENDTPAARSRVLSLLTGKRIDEGAAGGVNDFCSASRAIRREGGAVVVDGPWSVEWAVDSSSGTVGVLALSDSDSSASRRILVAIPTSGSPQVRNLGAGDDTNHNATLSGVTC